MKIGNSPEGTASPPKAERANSRKAETQHVQPRKVLIVEGILILAEPELRKRVDIKLFEWNVFGLIKPFDYWQLSLAADGARSYLNTSFSIGFWH